MNKYFAVFVCFFKLGLVSFGGPAAHLGYFRKVFVEQKKWLAESEYGQLVALSQFLPGPGSSQVGFAIGLKRAGLLGAVLAFLGFTLPSFVLMYGLAVGIGEFQNNSYLLSFIHVFKLLAVIVVLDAVLSMGMNFCRTKFTIIFAILTALVILLVPVAQIQLVCLFTFAVLGYLLLSKKTGDLIDAKPLDFSVSKSSMAFLALFILCLLGMFSFVPVFSNTFIAGSLVFGGGHVVLPLLQGAFVTSIGQESFIAGYAAAQAVPGPMFTFATYLGALSHNVSLLGALLATAGVFLPGFLLILAFHQQWSKLASHPKVSGIICGVNASVVGLLAATLITPIISSSIVSSIDAFIAVLGFILLRWLKLPIIYLILMASCYAVLLVFVSQ